MWSPLLALPLVLVGISACGTGTGGVSADSGYSYGSPEPSPHSGFEGAATVEVDGRTFLACPDLAVGQETPLIQDSCLTPGTAGSSRYGDYSMLDPSVDCPDGRKATDAGSLGWGFVGEPLIAQVESPPVSPGRSAVLDCLQAAGR